MFKLPLDTGVPGFRVGLPEDPPGFRIDSNGLVRRTNSDTSNDVDAGGLAPPTFQPAAAGDLACEGIKAGCQAGGDSGTTAMYRVEGRNLCMKCAVKQLGYGSEPSSALPGLLYPWSLKVR